MLQVLNATNVTSFLLFQMLHMLQMFQMLRYPLTLNCTRAVHCCMCIKNTLQFSTNDTQICYMFLMIRMFQMLFMLQVSNRLTARERSPLLHVWCVMYTLQCGTSATQIHSSFSSFKCCTCRYRLTLNWSPPLLPFTQIHSSFSSFKYCTCYKFHTQLHESSPPLPTYLGPFYWRLML